MELSDICITVIPRFNGCLVWNKAVLCPIEVVLRWKDEVRLLVNPPPDEIGVQNEGMSGQ